MQNTKRVLLVESDAVQMPSAQQAFKELGTVATVMHVTSTEDAMACLTCDPQNRPSVVLLDLEALDAKGIEFVTTLKEDHTLQHIPVVVLATPDEFVTIPDSCVSCLAGYLVKTDDPVRLLEIVETFDRYWSLSRVPAHT